MQKVILLIPSLNPNNKLLELISNLRKMGWHNIVVIDDGSGEAYSSIFRQAKELGCLVAVHSQNRGKGAALKTGIQTAIQTFGKGNAYITADADGQHLVNDICRVSDALKEHPDSLALGVRDFNEVNVPWKSRWGNRITSLFFRLTNGISCPDTQTGLRGIPTCLEELALVEEGNRYEYEMNFLVDASKKVPIHFVPIATVYEDGNKVSHFRPLADSALVYGRFLRFVAASLVCAATDYGLFYTCSHLLACSPFQTAVLATVLARIGSGILNFILNRVWSFHSREPAGREVVRYSILFICQMATSAGMVGLLVLMGIPSVLAKLVIDSCLFFVSFALQKNWVFAKEEHKCVRHIQSGAITGR